MARIAPSIPAEADLLCESCGYILNGLPVTANCPECGQPVAPSVEPGFRQPSNWEKDKGFLATTAQSIFAPTKFFRSTLTRGNADAALRFGTIHTAIASLLFAAAATLHLDWSLAFDRGRLSGTLSSWIGDLGIWIILSIVTFIMMTITTRFAARLSTWEASYRGLRLPLPVVKRGLAFHAAHYLPVAMIALATIILYQIALRIEPDYWAIRATMYLYILSAEVIAAAAYLFITYWIAMRNMMYANY